jgi:hypothetical protein
LSHKNRRASSTPPQGTWRVVLQIQESEDYVPVRRDTVLNRQRYEKNIASRSNNFSDGWQLVTGMPGRSIVDDDNGV